MNCPSNRTLDKRSFDLTYESFFTVLCRIAGDVLEPVDYTPIARTRVLQFERIKDFGEIILKKFLSTDQNANIQYLKLNMVVRFLEAVSEKHKNAAKGLFFRLGMWPTRRVDLFDPNVKIHLRRNIGSTEAAFILRNKIYTTMLSDSIESYNLLREITVGGFIFRFSIMVYKRLSKNRIGAPPLKLYPKMTIFCRYTKTIQDFTPCGLDGNVSYRLPLGVGIFWTP